MLGLALGAMLGAVVIRSDALAVLGRKQVATIVARELWSSGVQALGSGFCDLLHLQREPLEQVGHERLGSLLDDSLDWYGGLWRHRLRRRWHGDVLRHFHHLNLRLSALAQDG